MRHVCSGEGLQGPRLGVQNGRFAYTLPMAFLSHPHEDENGVHVSTFIRSKSIIITGTRAGAEPTN